MHLQKTKRERNPASIGEMILAAVGYAAEKTRNPHVLELVKCGDPEAIGYFHYHLAQQVGAFVGERETAINEVYFYHDYPRYLARSAKANLAFTLIVCTREVTEVLITTIEGLNQDLSYECRKLLAPVADSCSSLSNIYLVDEVDLSLYRGVAGVVRGVYSLCLCVWP